MQQHLLSAICFDKAWLCDRMSNLVSTQTLDVAMQGGVPRKHWDVLRREVLHTYGHEHVLTLAALQDAGRAVPVVTHEGRACNLH